MPKTSPSLPDSYPGLSRSFFIDTSSSGRAGCHHVTDLTKVIKSETTTIVDGAKERFDQVNEELIKLCDWTKKSIDQEVQDRIASDKAVGEIASATVAEIQSLKRKQKKCPAPLGTASTKRQ